MASLEGHRQALARLHTFLKHPGTDGQLTLDLAAAPVAVKLEHAMREFTAKTLPIVDSVARLVRARERDAWANAETAPQLAQQSHSQLEQLAKQRQALVKRAKPADVTERALAHAPAPADTPAVPRAPLPDIVAPVTAATAVTTLEDYVLREDADARYVRRMRQGDRGICEESLSKLPSYVQQLAWINTIEGDGTKLWYDQNAHVVATTGKEFHKLEVLSREYIYDFLRAPAQPNSKWERPCCGVTDIKTRQHIPCESVTMLGGGFACRELLLPSVMKRVLRAQAEARKFEGTGRASAVPVEYTPHFVLPRERQLCFLCHLSVTNNAYFRAKYFEDERRPQTAEELQTAPVIHGFCVMVNSPGEYRIESTLPGYETHWCGIVGPFPAYQRANYIPHKREGGIRGWLEVDSVVF